MVVEAELSRRVSTTQRVTADPLAVIVEQINQAFDASDYARTEYLLQQNMIAVWFGMDPSRFGEIVTMLSRTEAEPSPFIRAVQQLLFPAEVDDVESILAALAGGDDAAFVPGFPLASLVRVGRVFKLRMEGRAREAWAMLDGLDDDFGALQPVFDRDRGWGLMLAVQNGLTAMLAGEFQAALECFTRARLHVEVPAVAFLTRDACVKAAVLESLYGDEDRARRLLQEADGIPRTSSWVEQTLDASYTIAASRVLTDSVEECLEMLETVQLRDVGEIWPFYVQSLQRALLGIGDLEEGERRLAMFARMGLPYRIGEGFSGSALPLALGMNLMLQGRIPEARERLQRADESLVVTRVLRAVFELTAGRPKEALRLVSGIYEATRGLRFLEVWRLAVIAGSHFVLGDREECAETLKFVMRMPGGVTPREARFFLDEVSKFAEERFDEWPRRSEILPYGSVLFTMDREPLTARELEVTRDLGAGLTREEIAKKQFISMNTLKFHLRSVYRKLGVKSRTSAVLEAERRGLIRVSEPYPPDRE